jgi:GTP-binding protein EngB required for normal cell division
LTSDTPGKTRTLNFYELMNKTIKMQNIVMVDAPGIGYAKGSEQELKSWGKMVN